MEAALGTELLERDAEYAGIEALLDDAARSRGRVLVIEGEAGVGKTTLVRVTLSSARKRGFGCQAAQGYELERPHAFGVLRQLLGPRLADVDPGSREDLLGGAAALALPALDPASGAERVPEPAAVLHGLYWVWANLAATEPQLVCVDDAQWSDSPSLEALAYLSRRIADLPILLVVAMRRGDGGVPKDVQDALRDAALSPQPLSVAASRTLIARGLGQGVDRQFADACHAATGGNPFYLQELIEAVAAERIDAVAGEADRVRRLVPASLAHNVLVRLARLPPSARRLAQVVAVLGDRTELAQVAAFLEEPEASVADGCDALAAAAILEGGPQVRFWHPVVREVIYADIPAARRAADHARAAELLAADDADEQRIAAHLLHASPARSPERATVLLHAAMAARASGAPQGAVTYLSRALEEHPPAPLRTTILMELGSVEAVVGAESAAEHLEQAIAAAADDEARALAGRELVNALVVSGSHERAFEVATRMSRELSPGPGGALELEAPLARLVTSSSPEVEARLAERLERVADQLDGGTPGQRELLAALVWLRGVVDGRPANEWVPLAELALERGLASDRGAETAALALVVLPLTWVEHFTVVERAIDEAFAHARRHGSILGFTGSSAIRSSAALWRGRLREAESDAVAALAASDPVGLTGFRPWAMAVLVRSLTEQGRSDEAEEVLERLWDARTTTHPSRVNIVALLARARLWLSTDRLAAGVAEVMSIRRYLRAADSIAVGQAARALLALGEREQAVRVMREVMAVGEGAPANQGAALRDLGVVTGGDEGLDLLERSVAVLDGTEARLELARALVDLGGALRRSNQRARCREPLKRGLDLASEIGAVPLAEAARTELRVAGARPRRERIAGPESLTASERRVAEMAVEGMSNREIAQALFVTMKTVEFHLTQAYRKLDISSRADLATALAVRNTSA